MTFAKFLEFFGYSPHLYTKLAPLHITVLCGHDCHIRDASISPGTVHLTNSTLQSVLKVFVKC